MSEPTSSGALDWLDEILQDPCFDSAPDFGLMESDRIGIYMSDDAPHMQERWIIEDRKGDAIEDKVTCSCAECQEKGCDEFEWKTGRQLACHARDMNHRSYACVRENCNEAFVSLGELECHQGIPHDVGHNRIHSGHPYRCIECEKDFGYKANLLRHSQEKQHKPYGCSCGTLFSRIDVLNRHLKSFDTGIPQYPCTFCKRHRGADGFRRKDHLSQHLKQYHHHEIDTPTGTKNGALTSASRLKIIFPVCTHLDCQQYRGPEFQQLPRLTKEAQKPFRSQSEFTKHMREEHNECIFPCDILGCSRVGRRGYFREKDLIKHRQQEHPEQEAYKPLGKESRYQCTEPGCNANLDWSSAYYHQYIHHELNAACSIAMPAHPVDTI
ncbi:hypothetical protein NHQ30_008734 [Ciborinia camelliae]|nr:hypothetical protein NHQ30_008734 [Ciborinia camelliae]